MNVDVAIIGGGPAGSTTGTLIKKYNPEISVAIYEREAFPRDHVGESQLPTVSYVLDEMGVWDRVEAANFPIKIGATYRWGKTPELWDFDFLTKPFEDEDRPAKFEGQRRFTAFQVDRAIYDKILLDRAKEVGCEVFESTKVLKVTAADDRIESLTLGDGSTVTAKYYVDASGHVGILRRALDIPVEYPSNLKNIAIWDYWQNARWAETIGTGGTRIQVMSLGYGWIWFIPLGPERTSIGLVLPAEYYKNSGMTPGEIYAKAIADEERISALLDNASSEGKLQSTKDWSFLSSRQSANNWFLAGESSGFADPILSAGLNITQAAAREVAYSILELERGEVDATWLHQAYLQRTNRRVLNHIRFADYWYTANAQFGDLQEFTRQIAKDNNLDLTPEKAWQWIGQGGFIDEDLSTGTAGFGLAAMKSLGNFLSEVKPDSSMFANNVFEIDLEGAELRDRANYFEGRVLRAPSYYRGEKVLPLQDVFEVWVHILQKQSRLPGINREIGLLQKEHGANPLFREHVLQRLVSAMEALISDGWVRASYDPSLPLLPAPKDSAAVHWHIDAEEATAQ